MRSVVVLSLIATAVFGAAIPNPNAAAAADVETEAYRRWRYPGTTERSRWGKREAEAEPRWRYPGTTERSRWG